VRTAAVREEARRPPLPASRPNRRRRRHPPRPPRRPWLRYLAVGFVAIGVYYVIPAHGVGKVYRVVAYCSISSSAALAAFAGIRRHRPRPRRPWLLLACGQVVYAGGDTAFYIAHYIVGSERYPALCDLFYLAHYPLVVVGLTLLIRQRTPGRDVASLLDATTVAVTASTLSWLYVIAPQTKGNPPLCVEAVSVAYPVMDLALLAVGLRLVLGAGRRPASFFLLAGSLAAVFTADTLYVLQQVAGTYEAGNYLDAIWLTANLLLGASALHPTMNRLADRGDADERGPGGGRLAVLLASVLVAPTLLLTNTVAEDRASLRLVGVTCAVASVLTIARMHGLVADQRRLAGTDALTGLCTRRVLLPRLAQEIPRALRGHGLLGLFVIDVDHFKSINDRFGHPAGDRVLAEIADRLRRATRREDLLARYGGEEFALIAPHLNPDDLPLLAERLRQAVAGGPISLPDGTTVTATVSIGAAGCPSHAADEQTLLAISDAALYAAKAGGRDRVVVGRPAASVAFPADPTRVDPMRAESVRAESLRAEAGRAEAGRAEAGRAESGLDRVDARVTAASYLFGMADDVDGTLSSTGPLPIAPGLAGGPLIEDGGVEAGGPESEHNRVVGRWARALADELGLDEATTRRCELAGRLHDVGEVVIPESILAKAGPPSAEEWARIRAHPTSGARLARAAPGLAVIADVIAQHHERVDGLGYPLGLTGSEILLEARIVALCDAWAAMRSDRAYRPALSRAAARMEIERGRGTQFDPAVASIFLALVDRGALGDGPAHDGPAHDSPDQGGGRSPGGAD